MKLIIDNIFNANYIINQPDNYKITHIVSIGAPHPIQQIPIGFDAHPAKKLRLEFFDISCEERDGMKGPSEEDIRKLVEFFKEALQTEDPSFLIHCYAGKSRSTAAGLILLTMYLGDMDKAIEELTKIRPQATPNIRMVKLAADFFDKNK